MASAVAEMHAAGTSTRKVQRVAEKLGISRLSKDQVGAIARNRTPTSPSGLGGPWRMRTPHPRLGFLRASNVQERADREIKRRSRVVQVFPSEKSLERLVGSEQDEIRSESRCFRPGENPEALDEKTRHGAGGFRNACRGAFAAEARGR